MTVGGAGHGGQVPRRARVGDDGGAGALAFRVFSGHRSARSAGRAGVGRARQSPPSRLYPPMPRSLHRTAVAAVLAAGCVTGCATGHSTTPAEDVAVTPNTVRIETPGSAAMEARTVAEDRSVVTTIKTTPEIAWAKLPAVFNDLQIPVAGYVDAARQISAKNVRVRGHLGRIRMSQIVTCGSDMTGDDKANTYEVALDVISSVKPADGGQAAITTMVTANARPMAVSGDPVRCVTTGSLEKRIATAVLVKSATP
jgi:hypothetical protein